MSGGITKEATRTGLIALGISMQVQVEPSRRQSTTRAGIDRTAIQALRITQAAGKSSGDNILT
jgi:hypothetical protein